MQRQSEGTDGANGTIGTLGADDADGTGGIDPDARRRFLEGAKVGAPAPRMKERRPWDGLDPEAAADKGMNLRTNAYERALLRHASALKDGSSMAQTIRELIREGALARIEKARGG
jgi:hypothetical protein